MIRLDHPAVLLAALPVLLALLLLGRRRGTSLRRPAAAFAIRLAALLALSAALAGPSIASPPPGLSVVFALDVSDSVPTAALERAVESIRDASRAVSARSGASSLVLFAGRAIVARAPSREPLEISGDLRARIFSRRAEMKAASEDRPSVGDSRWRTELDPLHTRAASALLLARRLHPSGSESRTILVTDGVETDPDSAPPLDDTIRIMRFPDLPAPDVALRGLRVPLAVRAGEAFDVEVDVWADRETEARVALTLDGQVVSEDDAARAVPGGRSTLRVRSVQNSLAQGLHRIQAVVSAERDAESRNNAASASFNVVGKSRALILEGIPGEGEALSRLFTAQGIEFERHPVGRLASGGIDLERWAVVVLAGALPAQVPPPAAKALGDWLENGGGLFFIGTSAAAAPESFDRSELTRLLPVELEPPKPAPRANDGPGTPGPPAGPAAGPAPTAETRKVLAPAIALLLIIDKSGSMAGDPIALAKEAAIASLETLSDKDFLGVLAFDRQPVWVQKFESARRKELIKNNILRLFADGWTDLLPALQEASAAFKEQEFARTAGVKHAIVLSDGCTPPREYEKAVRKLSEEGVVVTSVCIVGPDGFRDQLMRQIAKWGQGRFFFADSFAKVPRIFTEETKIVVREAAAKEERDAPIPPAPSPDPPKPSPAAKPEGAAPPVQGRIVFKDDHEVLRGIPKDSPPPPLAGALAAKARPTSYVPLAFEGGAPALALWRFGLGRAAIWTSDFGGPWSAGWDRWPGTTKLFVQVVRHLSNAAEDVGLGAAVRVERRGDQVEFQIDEGVQVHELAPRKRELEVAADSGGARRCVLALEGGEVRQVSISRAVDGRTESLPVEFAPGPPDEIAAPPDRAPAFAWSPAPPFPLERMTAEAAPSGAGASESRVPLAAACLLAALVLLPLDVAVRRIS
ncbi:MAG TPA: VWA domain-containing protein [Planctomycetota bacterium]